jgi:hypothetical protein
MKLLNFLIRLDVRTLIVMIWRSFLDLRDSRMRSSEKIGVSSSSHHCLSELKSSGPQQVSSRPGQIGLLFFSMADYPLMPNSAKFGQIGTVPT